MPKKGKKAPASRVTLPQELVDAIACLRDYINRARRRAARRGAAAL
jgi:hypothetical protein